MRSLKLSQVKTPRYSRQNVTYILNYIYVSNKVGEFSGIKEKERAQIQHAKWCRAIRIQKVFANLSNADLKGQVELESMWTCKEQDQPPTPYPHPHTHLYLHIRPKMLKSQLKQNTGEKFTSQQREMTRKFVSLFLAYRKKMKNKK